MADANDPVAPGTPTDIIATPTGTLPGPSLPADGIKTEGPPADESRIVLPPPRREPPSPEALQRRLALLDHGILLPLLLALAFFVAARPVRNSDVLMHLATGRALVEGKYNPFSLQDPFSHTTAEARWVNHSWLYDVVLYGLHKAIGIPGLIVVKALLIAALALVLVSVGRASRGLLVPVLCTAVALVAMSPRLLLQPTCVSFLFLGLTLWLLQRGGGWLFRGDAAEPAFRKPAPGVPVTWKCYGPLLVLFALWANLDEWFFLGPLTVGLYALGQFIQSKQTERRLTAATPRPGEVRTLGLTFVLGLAACVLNPHHGFVFQLPVQLGLSDVSAALREDRSLGVLFNHPFKSIYFGATTLSAAGLTYFLLLLASLVSFGLEYRNPRWCRLLPFAFFLVLSALRIRAVPFFAVVAAPMMALNFQDAFRRLSGEVRLDAGWRRWLVASRLLLALLLVGVLAAAWPGWLQPRPFEQHRVALVDELDPSLRKASLWFKEQHASGALPADARGFNFWPDLANAFAWYCPEEKGFFDYRFHLFGGVTRDFANVRRGLLAAPSNREPQEADWEKILAGHHVDHVVLYERNNPLGLSNALQRLWKQPRGQKDKDWVLLYADGRTAVFGWVKKRPAYRSLRLDPEQQAYAPAEQDRAPASGMERLPQHRPFWLAFTKPLPPRSLEADEALFHLLRFHADGTNQAQRNQRVWRAALAARIALGGQTPGGLAPSPLLGPLFVEQTFDELLKLRKASKRPTAQQFARFRYVGNFLYGRFLRGQDTASPAYLLLASRACRRGLARNPEDALALARLGETYFQQLLATRERQLSDQLTWGDDSKVRSAGNYRPLSQLRHIQAVAALEQALLLQPDLQRVHGQLAILYSLQGFQGRDGRWHRGYWDLELRHRKAELKYARLGGLQPGETGEQFNERLQEMQKRIERLEKDVEDLTNRFENKKGRIQRVYARAEEAFDMNLAGKALEILLASNFAAFDAAGARLQIELALSTGRVREVRTWFEDARAAGDAKDNLHAALNKLDPTGFCYSWWRAMLAVATGDFAEADKHLQTIASRSARTFALNALLRGEAHVALSMKPGPALKPLTPSQAMALLVAKATVDAPLPAANAWAKLAELSKNPRASSTVWLHLNERERFMRMAHFSFRCFAYLNEEAQVHALRGLLALEWGETEKAEEAFHTALVRLGSFGARLPVRALVGELFFKLVEQGVRKSGAIDAARAKRLKAVVLADGKIDPGERRYLTNLKKAAKKTCPEFDSLMAPPIEK